MVVLPYRRLKERLEPIATTLLPRRWNDPRFLRLIAILISAVTIFLLDVWTPKGVSDGVLYLLPVAWIALWSSRYESILVVCVTVACTFLNLAGFALSPHGSLWLGLVNRVITISVMWTIACVAVLRKRQEEEVKVLRGLLPICSYCKRIRDDHGYWKQIEVYIAAHSAADFSHGLCPECGIEHYPDIFKERHARTAL